MRRKNTQMTTNILIVSLLLIGVVYALLQTNLQINGIAKILNNTWDVHFDNIQVNSNSVPIGTGDSAAAIDPENNCKVDFEVTLNLPGDFYEFTIDVVNSGTIDGMIGTLNKTLIINNETVSEVPDYLNYSITYDDGIEIEENHKVSAGTVETYLVRLEFKTDIEELPEAATIVTTLEPQYVQADSSAVEVFHSNRLYNVFAAEYNSGSGLVHEYTGAHKDSFTENGTQKIYHWYAPSGTQGNSQASQILEKNNVIFANHCWQMFRTTDTGGVKLLYNGETENNQCLDTRGAHEGYSYRTITSINANYWYSSDYEYDKENNVFRLTGSKIQSLCNASTCLDLVGKYTCRSTNETDTCSNLAYIDSYDLESNNVYMLVYNLTSPYFQFGQIQYNISPSSLESIGYMHGKAYSPGSKIVPTTESFSERHNIIFSSSVNKTYWYSDSISYYGNGATYHLENPFQIDDSYDPSNLVGKYSYFTSDLNTSRTSIYYIVGYQNSKIYYLDIYNGEMARIYYISDSFTDNLNGTYSLDDPQPINMIQWFNNASNYNGKYYCINNTTCGFIKYIVTASQTSVTDFIATSKITIGKGYLENSLTETISVFKGELIKNKNNYTNYKYTYNTNSDVCTDSPLRYIASIFNSGYSYTPNYYYGSNVVWDGTNYTLQNFIGSENYNNTNNLSTHRYLCLDGGTVCSSVAFIIDYSSPYYLFYVVMTDGISTLDSVYEKLVENNSNSTIKIGVEVWYKKHMLEFDNYIEDIIFCNDRTVTMNGGWDPNSSLSNSYVSFGLSNYDNNTLSCTNIADQFSFSNNQAKLLYKVGLITISELNLLNNSLIRKQNSDYWVFGQSIFNHEFYYAYNGKTSKVSSSGSYSLQDVSNNYGLRPVISLKPGIKIDGGEGSKEHPYVIKTD